jgi:hypothetical protein
MPARAATRQTGRAEISSSQLTLSLPAVGIIHLSEF